MQLDPSLKADKPAALSMGVGMAGRAISIVVEAAAAIIVARLLLPRELGVLATAIAIATLVSLVLTMQIDAQAARSTDGSWAAQALPWALLAGLAVIVLLVAVAAVFTYSGAGTTALVLVWYLPAAALAPVTALLTGMLRARGRVHAAVGLPMSTSALRLLLILVVAFVWDLEAIHVAAANSLSAAITLLVAFAISKRDLGRVQPATTTTLTSIVQAGIPLVMMAATWLMLQRTDVVVLSLIRGAGTAGRYVVALRPAEVLIELYGAAQIMFIPTVVAFRNRAASRDVYKKSLFLVSAIMAPLIVAYAFWADVLVAWVFGSEYVLSPLVYVPIAGWVYIHIMTGPSGYLLIAEHRNSILIKTGLVTVVFNLMLNLLLIPSLGAFGAALATLGAFAIMNGSYLWGLRNFLQPVSIHSRYLQWLIVLTLMMLVIHSLTRVLFPPSVGLAVVATFVGLGVALFMARLNSSFREAWSASSSGTIRRIG